ncbi:MAG: hypothetical protein AB1689_19910 [Thermodesulfobacteriota bacterium]
MTERDLGSLLASRLQGARDDAERIARELAQAGHLGPELATRLTDAVDGAVERARDMVVAALREPRRLLATLDLARGTDAVEHLARRIDALEDVVARLEEAVARLGPGRDRAARG